MREVQRDRRETTEDDGIQTIRREHVSFEGKQAKMAGIACGMVLSIPLWALIGGVVHLLT